MILFVNKVKIKLEWNGMIAQKKNDKWQLKRKKKKEIDPSLSNIAYRIRYENFLSSSFSKNQIIT
jgi:hypothetical protein